MNYKNIALEESTYCRLVGTRAALQLAVQQNPDRYPPWMQKGSLSFDSVVSFLLDHRDRDNERKQRFDRKRAARYTVTDLEPTAEPG